MNHIACQSPDDTPLSTRATFRATSAVRNIFSSFIYPSERNRNLPVWIAFYRKNAIRNGSRVAVADKEDTPAEDTKQDEEGGAGSSGGGPADNAAENVESTPAEGATAEGDDKEKEDEPKADSAAIDEEGGGGGDGAPQEQVAPPSNDAESNADKSSVVDKSDKSTVESEAQSNETAPAPTRSDSVQLPDRIEEDDEFEDEGRGT